MLPIRLMFVKPFTLQDPVKSRTKTISAHLQIVWRDTYIGLTLSSWSWCLFPIRVIVVVSFVWQGLWRSRFIFHKTRTAIDNIVCCYHRICIPRCHCITWLSFTFWVVMRVFRCQVRLIAYSRSVRSFMVVIAETCRRWFDWFSYWILPWNKISMRHRTTLKTI